MRGQRNRGESVTPTGLREETRKLNLSQKEGEREKREKLLGKLEP